MPDVGKTAMLPLNVLGIETALGFRTAELFVGDIAAIDFKVDVLVISAFVGSYDPTPGSVIGALSEKLGIHVGEYENYPALDLRDALSIWVSAPIESSTTF